ncbi:filaggrin-2 [Procambarus clarkii]|uniref:filaggrin-2 n=1 Tax=Procambarus clarkii TaxID=6728 RepID=UPI0037442869
MPSKIEERCTQPVTEAEEEVGGRRGSWAAVGGSGRLSCVVRAAPPPIFRWATQNGAHIETDESYVVHHPQLRDGLTLWSSIVEIRQVTQLDYGVYHCTAHNHLGSTTLARTLSPPTRPHPPLSLTVYNVTTSSVYLAWVPNYEGGMPRGYAVRYRAAGSLEYQVVEVSGGEARGATVNHLSPDTEYLFTVQARNLQGPSSYVTPHVTATTHGVPGQPSAWPGVSAGGSRSVVEEGSNRMPRLMLLIITLTGAALFALHVAVIGCFIRRRAANRNASASSSTKNVALDVYGVTPASTPGLVHGGTLLSLTSMCPPHLPSTTPPPYQEDHQTNVDDCDPTNLVVSNAAPHSTTTPAPTRPPAHSAPRQNGMVMVSRDSTTLFVSSRTMSPQNVGTFAPGQNISVPAPAGVEVSSTPPRTASPLLQSDGQGNDEKEPRQEASREGEVSSLCSSTYDTLPRDTHFPQKEVNSAANPAADQTSVSSHHSYEYSQGVDHPLYHPNCPHHHHLQQQHLHHQPLTTPTTTTTTTAAPQHYHPPPYDVQLYQQTPQGEQTFQPPAPYSSLNPSGLYDLSTGYQEARASPTSCVTGTPAGYNTLGPRRRRPVPSKFSSLQRPRNSTSHAHIHAHAQSQQQNRASPGNQAEDHKPLHDSNPGDRLGMVAVGQTLNDNSQYRGTFHSFVPYARVSPRSHTHTPHGHDNGGLSHNIQFVNQHDPDDSPGATHSRSPPPRAEPHCPRHGPGILYPGAGDHRTPRVIDGHTMASGEPGHCVRTQSSSPFQRTSSFHQRTGSPQQRTGSPQQRTGSPQQCTGSPQQRTGSPQQRTGSPQQRTGSPQQRTSSPQQRTSSPQQRTDSPQQRIGSPNQHSLSNQCPKTAHQHSDPSRRRFSEPHHGRPTHDASADPISARIPTGLPESSEVTSDAFIASGRPRFPRDFVRHISRTESRDSYDEQTNHNSADTGRR